MFTAEREGLVICSGQDREEAKVFSEFRTQYGTAVAIGGPSELPADAKLLFMVTVEDSSAAKSKKKAIVYVGVAHSAPFSDVLTYFNANFGAPADNGAFLLEGGFGVNPQQNAGQAFMKYGHQLAFHTKVELSRVAWR